MKKSEFNLTPAQKRAVETVGKNVLVSAGAGTGKTRVLAERFVHMVRTQKALATEILALTFTEKAANEMKTRILSRLSELQLESAKRDLEAAYISTIHAFAARVLREHPIEAGIDPDFRVIESEESEFLKEQALNEAIERECVPGTDTFELLRVYGEKTVREGVLKIFDAARHEGKSLEEFCSLKGPVEVFPSTDLAEAESLLDKLAQNPLAAEWLEFTSGGAWDWDKINRFKAWHKNFTLRGNQETKPLWKRFAAICKKLTAYHIDILSLPWREKIEKLSLGFEAAYEAGKRERGFLDFEDLQRYAVRFFKKPDGVHQKLRQRYREKFRFILVDEFQDTNFLQLELIELLSSGKNLFIVGDYKQSIYGFRGAEPEVFLAKESEYAAQKTGEHIALLKNFRTEKPVLDFLNAFFRNLWREDRLDWEDLEFDRKTGGDASVEILRTAFDEEEGIDTARLREAQAIADKIRELHQDGTEYGEIAVLFQAMTLTGIYEQALKRAAIPYFVVAGRSFYQQPEIRDLVSFLSFLENPLSDIPLAAALRSPLFQVKDDTLYWLAQSARKSEQGEGLYQGVKHFEDIPEIPTEEKDKIRFFTEVSRSLLAEKEGLRLTELLDRVIALTSAELLALADPQGVRRYANLRKLVNLAREYESYEPMPLGNFLRTLKRLETREIRESEAQVEAEKSGKVVRLLSVHRAKGLEFPVVFVADMGHQRHSSDSKTILAEAMQGYALRVRNEKTLGWEDPIRWQQLDRYRREKEDREWKRLLYVAATRVERKLIFSGVWKEKENDKTSFYDMANWMDWLMNSPSEILDLLRAGKKQRKKPRASRVPLAQKKGFRDYFGDFEAQPLAALFKSKKEREKISREGQAILARLELKESPPSRVIDLSVSAYVAYQKDPLHYGQVYEIGYPDRWETLDETEQTGEEPGEAGVSRADFGTAMHYFFERLDFKHPPNLDRDALRHFFRGVDDSKLDQAQKIIADFLRTPLFHKLQTAKVIKRELPFILNERHGRIHGVIDVLFQDVEGWHVLDYKTAVGDSDKVAASGYDLQLEIYTHAVFEILGEVPQSGILYFLENGWMYRKVFDVAQLSQFAANIRKQQEAMIEFRQGLLKSNPPAITSSNL